MKRLRRYSPPFNTFLIEALNIGRIIRLEKHHNMVAAGESRTDSG